MGGSRSLRSRTRWRTDAPQSMRPQALWSGSEAYLRTWAGLAHSVHTGQPAFEHVYGATPALMR